MATVAVYIDGFNLYFGMKAKFGRKHLWLDVVELARQLRPNDQVVVVRYFTAIVKNEPAAAQNQQDYLDALSAHNGALFELNLGRFKDRTIRGCYRCGSPYTCICGRPFKSYEEKETDVALGVTMVADAALGLADTTLLISADTDLVPALATVRRVKPQQAIILAMPPGNSRPSRRLTQIGGLGYFSINEPALRRSQLPQTVTDQSTGNTYVRPAKWS
ncbi:NYN domain-containing protein [Longispora sp. K20-0274]|uniref:NYN domain-containing protein n=1 Tax=Longispora sp. K20-0274 TaxID=3088255 RepID=UPI00399956CB